MQLDGTYPVRELSRLRGRGRLVTAAAWQCGSSAGRLRPGAGPAARRPGGGAPGRLEHDRKIISRGHLAIADINSQ